MAKVKNGRMRKRSARMDVGLKIYKPDYYKSAVWRYFGFTKRFSREQLSWAFKESSQIAVICTVCGAEVKYERTRSTAHMIGHLQRNHRIDPPSSCGKRIVKKGNRRISKSSVPARSANRSSLMAVKGEYLTHLSVSLVDCVPDVSSISSDGDAETDFSMDESSVGDESIYMGSGLKEHDTTTDAYDSFTDCCGRDTGSLEGRVAIVTGASSGIGEAVARHLSVAGAKVALGARRENRLTELKQSISASGGTVRYTVCDVVDRKQVDKLVSETESEFGPVDILVNNAGIMYYSEMTAQDHDGWMQTIDVNCKGVVNGVGAVLDSMTKRKSGHIINMSSDAGRKGFAGIAVYSGTKFFVEGFSQAVRHEMLEHKVKVTCIQPGDVKTELQALSTDQAAVSKYDLSNTGKVLCPDDIARAVVYAASQPKHVSVNELLVEPSHAPI